MSCKKAEWAAKLILDSNSDYEVHIVSADHVTVAQVESDGKGHYTPVAQTTTTEIRLLIALLKEIQRKHTLGEIL